MLRNRVVNFTGFSNVNGSFIENSVAGNHTVPGQKAIRMNQTYKVGPSKSLKVYPGDKLDIQVGEYHEGDVGFGTTGTPLTTLVTMVSGAFGGVSGGAGESGLIYNGVNSALTGFGPGGNRGDTQPAAYLNYILFDKNYKVLDVGAQVAPAAKFTKHTITFSTLKIKEAGYVFVYLSYENESNNWVYFDDLKVTHSKSNIIQSNEYYAYGLQTNQSWTRENVTDNKFLYNAGSELNINTGNYEMLFRGFDPVLGRMFQVDPKADKYGHLSPYNYAAGDPIFWNDPFGDDFGVSDAILQRLVTLQNYYEGTALGEYYQGYGGSGSYWSDQYSSTSYTSAGDFINSALNSRYGGSWSDGQAYFFKSDEETFAAGVAYNFGHNSWSNTYYGSYEASLVGYIALKVTGELLSPKAVHKAIDIVRSKHMYDGRPDFLASTGSEKPDPTYSYAGINGLSAWELYGVILADKTIDQFGIKDLAALTGILAGQPLLAKRFVTPGSSSGTSVLSKFLSKRLGTSPVPLPTIVANTGRVGIAMTTSVGKFVARGIPFIGWGILAYDASMILYNTQVEYNRITSGD